MIQDMTKHRFTQSAIWLPVCLSAFLFAAIYTGAEEQSPGDAGAEASMGDFHLEEAVMCERIEAGTPIHRTVAFSASKGRAFCYSVFDPVRSKTHIYHIWHYRDRVVSRKKLILKPHRWGTYSYHEIGNNVKGPWRVELAAADGKTIANVRFSVTD